MLILRCESSERSGKGDRDQPGHDVWIRLTSWLAETLDSFGSYEETRDKWIQDHKIEVTRILRAYMLAVTFRWALANGYKVEDTDIPRKRERGGDLKKYFTKKEKRPREDDGRDEDRRSRSRLGDTRDSPAAGMNNRHQGGGSGFGSSNYRGNIGRHRHHGP